jgi:hypothetical protein
LVGNSGNSYGWIGPGDLREIGFFICFVLLCLKIEKGALSIESG